MELQCGDIALAIWRHVDFRSSNTTGTDGCCRNRDSCTWSDYEGIDNRGSDCVCTWSHSHGSSTAQVDDMLYVVASGILERQ